MKILKKYAQYLLRLYENSCNATLCCSSTNSANIRTRNYIAVFDLSSKRHLEVKNITEFYASFACVFRAGKKGAVNVIGTSAIKSFRF